MRRVFWAIVFAMMATTACAETIDATIAVNAVLGQAVSVLSVLLFAGLLWVVRRFLGDRAAEEFKDRLQEAAEFAVAEGFRQLSDRVLPNKVDFKVQNQILAAGTKYMLKQFEDSVKAGKLDEQMLRNLVASRLGVVLDDEVAARLPVVQRRRRGQ